MQSYTRPAVDPSLVRDLVPQHAHGRSLTPDTEVICINRGVAPLRDKFDGVDYVIDPGLFNCAYGAALHFKARAVVPGTRNPETKKQESFIGILNVDRPEKCEPFTPEQCAAFGLVPEAIDRGALTDPAARNARVVATPRVGAILDTASQSGSLRPQLEGDLDALQPPDQSDPDSARSQMAADEAVAGPPERRFRAGGRR